jgi:hypothetical protein
MDFERKQPAANGDDRRQPPPLREPLKGQSLLGFTR